MSEPLDQPLVQLREQLREQQRAFVAHVFDTENGPLEHFALKNTGHDQFSDAQRFQIYRNNIFIGFREALSGLYPAINKLVGDEFFHHVAREYIVQHPANSGNVHAFGEAFPDFLSGFPGTENLAYLPDVARLEWAYHRVFHAQESAVLNVQELSLLDEDATERLRFQLSSSCCVLSSAYPVLKIWQMNQEGNGDLEVDLNEGGVQFVVIRSGSDVVFEPLNEAVFTFLHSLSQDRLFVDACAEALAVDSDCDVGAMLKSLIEQRLLTGFSCS